jgi:hypothetical protein
MHLALLNDYMIGFKRVVNRMAEQVNGIQDDHDGVRR